MGRCLLVSLLFAGFALGAAEAASADDPQRPSSAVGAPAGAAVAALAGPQAGSRTATGVVRPADPRSAAPPARGVFRSHYRGYYVGGGAVFSGSSANCLQGEPRRSDEGTFGMDYAPWYSSVDLHWFHGRRHQGGEGQYESDGKNNPFSVHKRKLVRVQQHKSK